jgi:hypothetical protein
VEIAGNIHGFLAQPKKEFPINISFNDEILR